MRWMRVIVLGVGLLVGCPGEEPDDDAVGDDDTAADDDDNTDDEPPFAPPDEPGPYPVGTDRFEVPSRTGITLPVQVWYPAVEDDDDLHTYDDLIPGNAGDGTAADCSATRPVLLFSHGNSGIRYQSWSVMEFLAGHGWVVAAPDHVENTFVDYDEERWPRIALRRPLDIADTFDALSDPATELGAAVDGCVDPAAGYAMMGHSFGGFTTYAVTGASLDVGRMAGECVDNPVSGCTAVVEWLDAHPGETLADHSDPRAWAGVPWAPAWHEYFGGTIADIDVPMLVVGADRDATTPWTSTVEPSYQELAITPRYLAQLEDAGHMSFTDFCDVLPAGNDDGCGEDFRPAEDVLETARTLSLAFLLTVLGDERGFDWLPPDEGVASWEAVE